MNTSPEVNFYSINIRFRHGQALNPLKLLYLSDLGLQNRSVALVWTPVRSPQFQQVGLGDVHPSLDANREAFKQPRALG